MMKTKLLTILLLLFFIADQYLIIDDGNEFRFFTKILLIPILLGIYLVESKHRFLKIDLLFVLGLIFSFFGDLFLLFSWGFLPGLGSFLLAHVFYIFCFRKLATPFSTKKYLPLILIYLFALIYLLFPHLNEMKIPVIVYGIVISAMLWVALKTQNRLLIIGALLFVVSDSILSFRLFMVKGLIYDVLVMLTYVLAQYFLVKGMLTLNYEKRASLL